MRARTGTNLAYRPSLRRRSTLRKLPASRPSCLLPACDPQRSIKATRAYLYVASKGVGHRITL
eukprot:5538666-Lingulodinium_polyedra.AAC.1